MTDIVSRLSVSGPQANRVILGHHGQCLTASEAFRPVFVVGPQRSRKTTSVVIPSLLEWQGPAVVTSVRTDVLWSTLKRRSELGRVFVYDPTQRLATGSAVTGWNPLGDCTDWDQAMRMAASMTDAGALSLRESAYWYGMAGQLLAPLLYAAASSNYTMGDVVRWVNTQEEYEVRALLASVDGSDKAMQLFDGMVSLEARVLSSIYATLMGVLRAYNRSSVLSSTEAANFTIEDFFDGGMNTLYLASPPDDQEELAPLFVTLLRRIVHESYRRESEGRGDTRLLLLLDEAGNIAPLSNMGMLASTSAGAGIQLITVWHDMSQMIAIYGEATARSIANNHSAWLILPGNRDPITAQFVREMLGSDAVAGMENGSGGSLPLRRIPIGSALCLYEGDEPVLLRLRSSSHDDQFRIFAGDAPMLARPRFAVVAENGGMTGGRSVSTKQDHSEWTSTDEGKGPVLALAPPAR